MIFSLFDSYWKQITLVHSLKILLFHLEKKKGGKRKKKQMSPNNSKNLKGASSTSEFSKISFSIRFSCFHTHFFVFCRDVIINIQNLEVRTLRDFLLFNSIRPFIDKERYRIIES